MDTIQTQEMNANLNNLKKITRMYKSMNEYKKYRPAKWIQFCIERVMAYMEDMNEG